MTPNHIWNLNLRRLWIQIPKICLIIKAVSFTGFEFRKASAISPLSILLTKTIDEWDGFGGTVNNISSPKWWSKSTFSSLFAKDLWSVVLMIHGDKSSIGPLPCQKLQEFYKCSKKIELPSNYNPLTTLFSLQDDLHIDIQMNDVAWILSRLDLSNLSGNIVHAISAEQTMPTWSAFNSIVSNESMKVQQVGFLLVLPHPVTKYETVYKD